jgi:peptidoglycan/xylan/chitin deacetylase (PgdA/CDA1 family)
MKKYERREFIKASLMGGIGIATLPGFVFEENFNPQTTYIAAYDTESESCINNISLITDVHRKHNMPATFFILADKLTEQAKKILTHELNDPLFEIASHSFNHKLIIDSSHGKAVAAEQVRKEIVDSKKAIEDVFGKQVHGFRPGVGFSTAFKKQQQVLALISEAGYTYTTSMLWGPQNSLPAEIIEPFNYSDDGFASIWEIPGHGWHENLLKNNNKTGAAKVTLWPPAWPEVIPKNFIKTPQEEFAIYKLFIDRAAADNKKHLTFIWHPWSMFLFDKEMKMPDLTFSYIKEMKLKTATFKNFHKTLL